MTVEFRYAGNCVGVRGRNLYKLNQMIAAARDVTRRTFLQHVNRSDLQQLEHQLGYVQYPQQGLTMAGDYHVSYHRSHWGFAACYFFTHSAIEYYFLVGAGGCESNVKFEQSRSQMSGLVNCSQVWK
jgi:hypothetical protein